MAIVTFYRGHPNPPKTTMPARLGANAIITMRMDSDSISQNMQEVLAYGTAVVIEKED